MRVLGHRYDISRTSLGNRRGRTDLAPFNLDLTWARADFESAARSKDYPSPPMSGSPPLPSKGNHEFAERGQGSHQATTQDAHRGNPATQTDVQLHRAGAAGGPIGRGYGPESEERLSYGFPRQEAAPVRPAAYHQQGQVVHSQFSYLPPPGPGLGHGIAPAAYPIAVTASSTTTRPSTGQQEVSIPPSSPKLQRKTKGHVASACVPCKRAHLRQVSPQFRLSLQPFDDINCDMTFFRTSLTTFQM